MGGKSKSRSKQMSVSGPSSQQSFYSNMIQEAFFPGSTNTGGYITDAQGTREGALRRPDGGKVGYGVAQGYDSAKDYLDKLTTPRKSALPGSPGPIASSQDPRGQVTARQEMFDTQMNTTEQDLRDQAESILPSFDDAKYKDFFAKYESGELPEETRKLTSNVINMVQDPVAASSEQMSEIYRMSGADGAMSLPDPTPLQDEVTEIFEGLPNAMTSFMVNVFDDSTDAGMERELENLSSAIYETAASQGEDLLKSTLGDFASQGVATSGAALNAIKDGVIEIAKNTNAQLAQARIQALGTLYQARQTGVSLLSDLLQRGEQQQSLTLSKNIKMLELESAKQLSKINAHTQMQLAMNQQQMQLFGIAVDEQRQVEQNKERTQQFIYTFMGNMATAGPGSSYGTSSSRSSSFNIQPISLGFTVGAGSDRRLKEDISLIGQSPSGINIYKFRYKDSEGYYQGVMADEVFEASILRADGYYSVDYNRLDVEFKEVQ